MKRQVFQRFIFSWSTVAQDESAIDGSWLGLKGRIIQDTDTGRGREFMEGGWGREFMVGERDCQMTVRKAFQWSYTPYSGF